MANLRRILGTMTFGGALNEAQAHGMLKNWSKLGYREMDSALMYQSGKTDKIIGNLELCRDPNKAQVSCKANPTKGYKAEDIIKQLDESLESLKTPSCDIFYLHWPDHDIPIEETLKGVDQLHRDGKFKEFGLSNYFSWETVDVYHICRQNGYVLPTVYQGMYNALTRDIELELIPALRRFGIRFYVYNPLAGGILSGKYKFDGDDEKQTTGRFFSNQADDVMSAWAPRYRERYWQDNYKHGVQEVQRVLDATYNKEVSLIQASMRWLIHHSKLQDDDGIVLGFSKPEHFQPNIDAVNGDPLHEDVVVAFENAWDAIKSDCPIYNPSAKIANDKRR